MKNISMALKTPYQADNPPKIEKSAESAAEDKGQPETDNVSLQQQQEDMRTRAGERYDRVMAEKAVEYANQKSHTMGNSAKFEYNDKIDRITITITDRNSHEVVREIPAEEIQKMLERIHTNMAGMLMDTEI